MGFKVKNKAVDIQEFLKIIVAESKCGGCILIDNDNSFQLTISKNNRIYTGRNKSDYKLAFKELKEDLDEQLC